MTTVVLASFVAIHPANAIPGPVPTIWAPYGSFVPSLQFQYYSSSTTAWNEFLAGKLDLAGSPITGAMAATCAANPDFVLSTNGPTCALRDVGRGNMAPVPIPAPTGLVDQLNTGYPNFWTALNGEKSPSYVPLNTVYIFGGGSDVMRWGETSGTAFLNPFHVGTVALTAAAEYDLTYEVYDTLLKQNPSNPTQVFCWMCNFYAVRTSGGNNQFYFSLRQTIRWHNGPALTCNDIRFTLLNFKNVPVGSPRWSADVAPMISVNTLSPFLCKVVMTGTNTLAQLQALADVPIIPRHIWDSGDNFYGSGVGRADPFKTNIAYDPIASATFIGSGPFVCQSLFPPDLGKVGTGCVVNPDGTRGGQSAALGGRILLQEYDFTSQASTLDPFYQYMRSYNINWGTGPYTTTVKPRSGQFQEFSYADMNNDVDPIVDFSDVLTVIVCYGANSGNSYNSGNCGLANFTYYHRPAFEATSGTISGETAIVLMHFGDTWEWPYNWNPCAPPALCLTNIDGFTP